MTMQQEATDAAASARPVGPAPEQAWDGVRRRIEPARTSDRWSVFG